MIVMALRTDNPTSELYLYEGGMLAGKESWQGHRELSATIHIKIQKLLSDNRKTIHDLKGIIFYQGPGSFTGLRIGVSVANAIGQSLGIPVAATNGEQWLDIGLKKLVSLKSFSPAEPFYGSEAHATPIKK